MGCLLSLQRSGPTRPTSTWPALNRKPNSFFVPSLLPSSKPLKNPSPVAGSICLTFNVSHICLLLKQWMATSGSESKPKKKICCACPETKKLRDECIVEHGEEACAKWIEAHRICLRAEGFNV
ncbi:hypothetical protein V6N13_074803 [Hibiscus sabdariffa]